MTGADLGRLPGDYLGIVTGTGLQVGFGACLYLTMKMSCTGTLRLFLVWWLEQFLPKHKAVESIVESWVSVIEYHSSSTRGLKQDRLEDEMTVSLNGPEFVHFSGWWDRIWQCTGRVLNGSMDTLWETTDILNCMVYEEWTSQTSFYAVIYPFMKDWKYEYMFSY